MPSGLPVSPRAVATSVSMLAIASVEIWTCYPGMPGQQWYYTEDKHLAVTGGNRCLGSGRYILMYNSCMKDSESGTQVWNLT
ncbi:hypothetical protein NCC49_003845 [Naganishia albida]|nr:hypothetical protein NCC49_003845 [Naganishia albida]